MSNNKPPAAAATVTLERRGSKSGLVPETKTKDPKVPVSNPKDRRGSVSSPKDRRGSVSSGSSPSVAKEAEGQTPSVQPFKGGVPGAESVVEELEEVGEEEVEEDTGLQIGELLVAFLPLNLRTEEWSVEEDQFLVRHMVVKKTPLRQIETLYYKTAKGSPETYTKDKPTLDELRSRFEVLSSEEMAARFALLNLLVVAQCEKEEEEKKREEEEAEREAKEELEKANKGKAKPEEEAAAEEEEVEVVVVERDGRERRRIVKKLTLLEASVPLRRMVSALPTPKPGTPQTLVLDPNAPQFDSERDFKPVQWATVDRLLTLCEMPDCLDRAAECEDELREVHQQVRRVTEDSVREVEGRRDTWLGEIRRRAVREEAGLRQRNEADFEAHVRHIREAYDQRLADGMRIYYDRAQAAEDDITLFFASEKQRIQELVGEHSAHNNARVQEKLDKYNKAIEQVFSEAPHTMKLAILGDLLEAPWINDACLSYMKREPMRYKGCSEWLCGKIADRFTREMLPAMQTQEVLRLSQEQRPANFIAPDAIEREMKSRKWVFQDELQKLPNDALQELGAGGKHPLQMLIATEVKRRFKSRGTGSIDPDLVNKRLVKLSNNNATVAITHTQRFVSVQGLIRMEIGGVGKIYFEVKVDLLDSDAGSTAAIGVDVVRTSVENGPIPGMQPGPDMESYGASIQNDGLVFLQGRGEQLDHSFSQSSVVGVGVDLTRGTVSFFLNGKKVEGPAGHTGTAQLKGAVGVSVVPAASLFGARMNSRAQVTFNFAGPFAYDHMISNDGWVALDDSQYR